MSFLRVRVSSRTKLQYQQNEPCAPWSGANYGLILSSLRSHKRAPRRAKGCLRNPTLRVVLVPGRAEFAGAAERYARILRADSDADTVRPFGSFGARFGAGLV